MRLSRTHFVPVLAIVAGGVIGASLSFSLLELRSDDAAVPESVVNAYESVERAEVLLPQEQTLRFFTFLRGGVPRGQTQWISVEVDGMVVTGERIEVDGMVITPVVGANP
ncbi:MAG: hypothetical protein IIB37_10515 [Gemmatimonadetes bacterium]|nr:hypothetical protein [Gemmatimonadota bacterium]